MLLLLKIFLYRFWLELNGAISTAVYKPLKTALLPNLYCIITFGFSRVNHMDSTSVNSA